MKKLIMIIVLILCAFQLYSKDFDFNKIYGIKWNMPNDKILANLTSKDIKFEKTKSPNNVLLYSLVDDIDFNNNKIKLYWRVKKNIVIGMALKTDDEEVYNKIQNSLVEECDCYYNDGMSTGSYDYCFNNLTIVTGDSKKFYTFVFVDSVRKCED